MGKTYLKTAVGQVHVQNVCQPQKPQHVYDAFDIFMKLHKPQFTSEFQQCFRNMY